MVVTQELIQRAKQIGACNSGLPPVGATLDELTQEQLIWAEARQLLTSHEQSDLGSTPLFAMATSGYGFGDGYGGGCGDGCGDGYGYSYSYGYGYGYDVG